MVYGGSTVWKHVWYMVEVQWAGTVGLEGVEEGRGYSETSLIRHSIGLEKVLD